MSRLHFLWVGILALKLLLSAIIPIIPDEAYYWVWSHNLRLSYFDHPPFVAWLFRSSHFLEDWGQAIRWPGVIMAHCIFLIWLQILRDYLTKTQLFWWFALCLLSPLTGLGSIIVTPDIPLAFFWSLSLLIVLRLIDQPKWYLYLALGAFLGLGFCSKYTIVLFVPSLVIWLTVAKLWQRVWWPGVGLTVGAGLLLSMPVIIWNVQNEFISFTFQLSHGLESEKWNPFWPLEYLLGLFGFAFPTILYVSTRTPKNKDIYWLMAFAWTPIIFFFLTSFRAKVEANWPVVAYPALFALAVYSCRSLKPLAWPAVTWSIFITLFLSQLFFRWLPIKPELIRLKDLTEYDVLVDVAENTEPFYAANYQMASVLWYRLKRPVYKLRGLKRPDFYDFLEGSLPPQGKYHVALLSWQFLPVWAKYDHEVIDQHKISEKFRIFTAQPPPSWDPEVDRDLEFFFPQAVK